MSLKTDAIPSLMPPKKQSNEILQWGKGRRAAAKQRFETFKVYFCFKNTRVWQFIKSIIVNNIHLIIYLTFFIFALANFSPMFPYTAWKHHSTHTSWYKERTLARNELGEEISCFSHILLQRIATNVASGYFYTFDVILSLSVLKM